MGVHLNGDVVLPYSYFLSPFFNIQLYKESSGETGWDIFSLTYHVTAPLTAVLTKDAMATYARLFRFLWKLKRVEYLLSNTWCRHMTAAHALRVSGKR